MQDTDFWKLAENMEKWVAETQDSDLLSYTINNS